MMMKKNKSNFFFFLDKIHIHIIIRVLFVIFIIFFYSIWEDSFKKLEKQFSIIFITSVILFSIIYIFIYNFFDKKKIFVYLQIIIDSVFTSLLLYVIQGSNFLIVFLFLLTITNSSILLDRTGAILAASLSFFFTISVYLIKLDTSFNILLIDHNFWKIFFSYFIVYFTYATIINQLTLEIKKKEKLIKSNLEELEDIRELKQVIVDNIDSGIIVTNSNGNIIFINNVGEKILGYSFENIDKFPIKEIFIGNNRKNEINFNNKIIGYSKNKMNSVNDLKGNLYIFKDLNEIKKYEEKIKRNEQLAYVGQMSASIAHDIRNPLASIFAAIQLIDKFSNEAKIKNLINISKKEINRMDSLIKEFLNYTKMDKLNISKINLDNFFKNIKDNFNLRNINLLIDNFSNYYFMGDLEKLKQIFINLIENSIDAIEKEDKIIKIYLEEKNSNLVIVVEDNGEGIDDAIKNEIFNPFYTTKNKGTGLGLSIVNKFIDLHKGDIEVFSEKNKGTKFKIFLQIRKEDGHSHIDNR